MTVQGIGGDRGSMACSGTANLAGISKMKCGDVSRQAGARS